jgi:hypothetical protein
VVEFWRIITESREGGRPGFTADAAYNKVATGLILSNKGLGLLRRGCWQPTSTRSSSSRRRTLEQMGGSCYEHEPITAADATSPNLSSEPKSPKRNIAAYFWAVPPLALRPSRCVFLLLKPPRIAKGFLNIPQAAWVWALGPVVDCSDRGIGEKNVQRLRPKAHKRTEGRAPVWGSEIITKAATTRTRTRTTNSTQTDRGASPGVGL